MKKITQNGYYDFKKFFKFLINKFMNKENQSIPCGLGQ